jgi:hypothetical protein
MDVPTFRAHVLVANQADPILWYLMQLATTVHSSQKKKTCYNCVGLQLPGSTQTPRR